MAELECAQGISWPNVAVAALSFAEYDIGKIFERDRRQSTAGLSYVVAGEFKMF